EWIFGSFMSKFISFFFFLNMYSSVLLFVISVDRCVVVMFPVWAQNKRNPTSSVYNAEHQFLLAVFLLLYLLLLLYRPLLAAGGTARTLTR
ncbi:hypothetical protein NFI96_032660, partial [Prochilodus magdalenae]